MMRLLGMGTSASCAGALELLKPLAERLSPETKLLEYGHGAVVEEVDTAALAYVLSGYAGMEVAQTNAAYLLQHGSVVDFAPLSFEDGLKIVSPEIDNKRQAIKFHKYAAEQGNMASLLAIGDIYFYGYGIPANREKAGEAYRRAAEIATSMKGDSAHSGSLAGGRPKNKDADDLTLTPPVATAFAYFNLGVMHQLGMGLQQDLHLAKRFYDLSMGSHATASGPCTIALFSLQAQMLLEELLPKVTGAFETVLSYFPDVPPEMKKYFPGWVEGGDGEDASRKELRLKFALILSLILPPIVLVVVAIFSMRTMRLHGYRN